MNPCKYLLNPNELRGVKAENKVPKFLELFLSHPAIMSGFLIQFGAAAWMSSITTKPSGELLPGNKETRNPTPTATPYQLGIPIDSIAPSTDEDDSPAQICCKDAYQSLIGRIGWLGTNTRPDLSAVHSFLSS